MLDLVFQLIIIMVTDEQFSDPCRLESEGVPTKVGMGNLERARTMLSGRKPFLATVYSNMNPNGGAKHAMLVIGIDSQVYVNDPQGKRKNNSYSISQFFSLECPRELVCSIRLS